MKLTVFTMTGEVLKLEVDEQETAGKVKAIIEDTYFIVLKGLALTSGGEIIEDGVLLSECNVQDGDVLFFSPGSDWKESNEKADKMFQELELEIKVGKQTKVVKMFADNKVVHLKAVVQHLVGIHVSMQRVIFKCKQLEDDITFEAAGIDTYNNRVQIFEGKLLGGGVIKKHLKKEDAVKALREKACAAVPKPKCDTEGLTFPPELVAYLDNSKKVISDLMFMKAQGTNVVQTGLRSKTVSDQDLETIKDIMKFSSFSRRGTSEERILKSIDVMFPKVSAMEQASKQVLKVQAEIIAELMAIYTDEYHCYSNGVAHFDNETFVKHIEAEETRRETLRDVALQGQGAQTEASGSGCVIC